MYLTTCYSLRSCFILTSIVLVARRHTLLKNADSLYPKAVHRSFSLSYWLNIHRNRTGAYRFIKQVNKNLPRDNKQSGAGFYDYHRQRLSWHSVCSKKTSIKRLYVINPENHIVVT